MQAGAHRLQIGAQRVREPELVVEYLRQDRERVGRDLAAELLEVANRLREDVDPLADRPGNAGRGSRAGEAIEVERPGYRRRAGGQITEVVGDRTGQPDGMLLNVGSYGRRYRIDGDQAGPHQRYTGGQT